jgi:hypothetical protein
MYSNCRTDESPREILPGTWRRRLRTTPEHLSEASMTHTIPPYRFPVGFRIAALSSLSIIPPSNKPTQMAWSAKGRWNRNIAELPSMVRLGPPTIPALSDVPCYGATIKANIFSHDFPNPGRSKAAEAHPVTQAFSDAEGNISSRRPHRS